jgi:signal transduction histidine kinase/DNA-binding response OmpR family regulator
VISFADLSAANEKIKFSAPSASRAKPAGGGQAGGEKHINGKLRIMKKKILLVDDDRVLLKYLTNVLERKGHEVETVEDGISALNRLTVSAPDVIFLDLILPKIDGDKLCHVIRKMDHLKASYLVVISAAVAELEIDLDEIGADRYIAKGPFAAIAENVLGAIKDSEKPLGEEKQKSIMGLDSVYPRRLTKELLSRNRHLATILESMAEGILEIYEGKIVFANSAAISLLRVPEEKLLLAYPPDLFDESTRTRVEKLMNATPAESSEIGEKIPIELNGIQITIQYIPVSDAAATSIMLLTDVTERKQLEMQLQHAQKMEAIGTIASGVAHNFRNTLTGILVNSQVIQENYPDHAGLNELGERIRSAVKGGSRLVDRLMQFSRRQTKKEFQKLDLVAIIAETYQIVRKSFDQKFDIQLDIQKSLPILGDHPGLSQVMMNLFTNARDAMPGGGIIKIESRQEEKKAVIKVSDTGEGMDKTTRDRCFDPFFTTKEISKGTGLGLSTTYGTVKSHEGEILVESEPGQGTTFTLSFPLVDIDKLTDFECPSEIIRGSGEHVLVVDDEAEIQIALQDLLECLGYRPLFASEGAGAIKTYEDLQPEVVLMDVNMPEMDGITCAEKIMDYDPDARIAILSGYNLNGPELADERVNKLIKGYLAKPVDIAELSTLLARLVG